MTKPVDDKYRVKHAKQQGDCFKTVNACVTVGFYDFCCSSSASFINGSQ